MSATGWTAAPMKPSRPEPSRRGPLALAVVLLLLASACTARAPGPEPAAAYEYGAYVGY